MRAIEQAEKEGRVSSSKKNPIEGHKTCSLVWKQVLHIPNWTPTSVNKLLSAHYKGRNKIKQKDYELIAGHAMAQGISPAVLKRRVSLHLVVEKGQRMGDESNLWKILEDGLVNCRLLVNDSPRWIERGKVNWSRGTSRETFVILEEVE